MATWITTQQAATAYVNGRLNPGTATIKSVTDGNDASTDNEFTIGEKVTMTFGDDREYEGTYLGLTNAIEGGPYMVIEFRNSSQGIDYTVTYVIEAGATKSTGPLSEGEKRAPDNIAGLNIDTNPMTGKLTVCFFPGTLIATPSGERKVEELASGDLVLIGDSGAIPATWFGRKFARHVYVKWIGWQTISTLFGPADRLMPVRFATGSLGGGGQASSSA